MSAGRYPAKYVRRCILFRMLPMLSILSPFAVASSQRSAGTFVAKTLQGRNYKLYIPPAYRSTQPVPLLVMLHGCTQTPDDFALGTEMNVYADQHNFIVVYPEQSRSANRGKCWNWFRSEHQVRGRGEPAEIVAIVDQIKDDYAIDDNRVYVAGISAGAAMTVILGATYPDVFAAIGVCSGVTYRASTSVAGSLVVMARGGPDPTVQGHVAYSAMGDFKRVVPVIVFHGTSDTTVSPKNGDQVIAQWARTNQLVLNGVSDSGIGATPSAVVRGSVPGGRTFTRYTYTDHTGKVILQQYMVDGMKHGWSGGSRAGSYTDPQGPRASPIVVEFLLQHTLRAIPTVEVAPPRPVVVAPPQPVAEKPEPKPGLLKRIGGALRRLVR